LCTPAAWVWSTPRPRCPSISCPCGGFSRAPAAASSRPAAWATSSAADNLTPPPGDVYVNQGQGSPGQRYLAAWLRAGGQLTRSVEKMREEVATAEAAREEAAKRLRREGDAAEAARAAEAVRAAEAARIRGANAARDDRAKNRERANHRPGLRPRRSGPPS